ncbi:MAG: hypothetical protein ACRCWF_17905 [Beijerinckiaceae bacterium]
MAIGLDHAVAAMLTCAYALGSPNVAPIFPRDMEVALVRYHKEVNVIGKGVHDKYVVVANAVGLPSFQRQATASQ